MTTLPNLRYASMTADERTAAFAHARSVLRAAYASHVDALLETVWAQLDASNNSVTGADIEEAVDDAISRSFHAERARDATLVLDDDSAAPAGQRQRQTDVLEAWSTMIRDELLRRVEARFTLMPTDFFGNRRPAAERTAERTAEPTTKDSGPSQPQDAGGDVTRRRERAERAEHPERATHDAHDAHDDDPLQITLERARDVLRVEYRAWIATTAARLARLVVTGVFPDRDAFTDAITRTVADGPYGSQETDRFEAIALTEYPNAAERLNGMPTTEDGHLDWKAVALFAMDQDVRAALQPILQHVELPRVTETRRRSIHIG